MELPKNIVVIVAHPDDEVLWCGGTILMNPKCNWFIACLCREFDTDRAPKFRRSLKELNAQGEIGNLDDGVRQRRLDRKAVEKAILALLPSTEFDLIITHSPFGEYTKHLRHEEIGKAVISLWKSKRLKTKLLWPFAYEDGNKNYYPKPFENAPIQEKIPKEIWEKKYRLITELYGYAPTSFEAHSTQKLESFWQFNTANEAIEWMDRTAAEMAERLTT